MPAKCYHFVTDLSFFCYYLRFSLHNYRFLPGATSLLSFRAKSRTNCLLPSISHWTSTFKLCLNSIGAGRSREICVVCSFNRISFGRVGLAPLFILRTYALMPLYSFLQKIIIDFPLFSRLRYLIYAFALLADFGLENYNWEDKKMCNTCGCRTKKKTKKKTTKKKAKKKKK